MQNGQGEIRRAMNQQGQETFPTPRWHQAAAWLGADFFGLFRMLARNGFRVAPSKLPDCLADLYTSLLNTALAQLQTFYHGRRIDAVELDDDPVFILGHWRTGTTLLHELFALDPRYRCPTTYECFAPGHFVLSEGLLKGPFRFLLPSTRPVDAMEMGWDRPQEDEFALCNLGIPSMYLTMAFPNRPVQYPEYLSLENVSAPDLARWKRSLRTFFKQLTYQRRGRLVLKSPPHTFRLPILLDMFPRACFIHIVRDPYRVFVSTVRLWKSLYAWQGYQEPNYAGLEEHVFRTFDAMYTRLEATRHLIDPSRFCEVRYEDLVRDPIAQFRAIYQKLDLGSFNAVEPSVRRYFAERADYRTNRYEMPPSTRDEIVRRWGRWIEQYGYAKPATPE